MSARNKYRITFHEPTKDAILDPLELAWLLSKHECDVVAKCDTVPVLFMLASSYDMLMLMVDLRCSTTPLILERVEVMGEHGYVDVEGV